MDKNELIKKLEELRDIKDYSNNKDLNTGYRTAMLDAIDLVHIIPTQGVVQASISKIGILTMGNKYKTVAIGPKDVVVITDNGRKEHFPRIWFD